MLRYSHSLVDAAPLDGLATAGSETCYKERYTREGGTRSATRFIVSALSIRLEINRNDQQAFEGYFADFACFFHQPAETPAELPLDYSMGYFLVYEAWRLGTEAGSSYQQDANLLYLIPEEEISETAEALLGMESFDPGKVAEWPFGRNPPEGFQLYSEESSLPYLNVVSQAVSCQDDTVTVQAVLETGMGNEGETPPNVSLIYEFQRIPSESGELYRLLSISEA